MHMKRPKNPIPEDYFMNKGTDGKRVQVGSCRIFTSWNALETAAKPPSSLAAIYTKLSPSL